MDMPSPQPQSENQHYELKGLLGRIEEALKKISASKETVTIKELAQVDEFHFRGLAATKELIAQLGAKAGDHILDAGSGLGGPARQLAAATGCHVTGVDLSDEYTDVGQELNKWVGLQDKVALQKGDVTDLTQFGDATFDGAWTIHVGMNIRDKAAFYREVSRVLKPGSRFVIYDVIAIKDDADAHNADAHNANAHYPMPWSRSPGNSHLVTADQLDKTLGDQGFDVVEAKNQTGLGAAFVDQIITRIQSPDGPPPLGLNLVLGPVMKEILPNMKRNFAEGRIGLVSILAHKIS